MKTIILKPFANQKIEFILDNIRYSLTLQSRDRKTYLSYTKGGKTVLLNRICLNKVPIDGLFMFEDTEGNLNPYFTGFKDRFKLRLLG